MRTIKFRAWEKGRMWSWLDLVTHREDGYCHSCSWPLPIMALDHADYKWMEFTGLYDKNGKEIYEGDLCRLPDCGDNEGIYEMRWDGDMLGWRVKRLQPRSDENNIYSSIGFLRSSYVEVIGNIYENPELLTRQKA